MRAAQLPKEQQEGARVYRAYCASCHGAEGQGSNQGPPMLHPLQARHHGDFAFRRAIEDGVRPHHYDLGAMPSLPEVGEEGTSAVVDYVRWMQEQAGLR